MKSYTDLEQSKKLAEILPLESADMTYRPIMDIDFMSNSGFLNIPDCYPFNEFKDCNIKPLPCWSLAALMNLLPSEFTEVGKFSTTTYKIDIRKYKFTDDVDIYQIAYGSIKIDVDGQSSYKDMINTGQKEDLIDAAFQIVCWLKENGKI